MTILRILTGGQTGVDQGALRAARACGFPTGGVASKDWMTEDGPAPWLADWGLTEGDGSYALRTRANVLSVGGVLILSRSFPRELTGGTLLTLRIARENDVPFRNVHLALPNAGHCMIRDWLTGPDAPAVLMVAGPRESKCPGIGADAEAFMTRLLRSLKTGGSPDDRPA